MSDHTKEFDARCTSCEGSGLYVGFAEKDGMAVVCSTCKGTGVVHRVIEWDDPPIGGPTPRDDVAWVLECNAGVFTGIGDEFPPGSFGGMSYDDWRAGRSFVRGMEMRQHVCPHWWYQSACRDNYPYRGERCGPRGSFTGCEHFPNKAVCWAIYDIEVEKA
jgi:hypothetical protein